jgi:hypothetical protein
LQRQDNTEDQVQWFELLFHSGLLKLKSGAAVANFRMISKDRSLPINQPGLMTYVITLQGVCDKFINS